MSVVSLIFYVLKSMSYRLTVLRPEEAAITDWYLRHDLPGPAVGNSVAKGAPTNHQQGSNVNRHMPVKEMAVDCSVRKVNAIGSDSVQSVGCPHHSRTQDPPPLTDFKTAFNS